MRMDCQSVGATFFKATLQITAIKFLRKDQYFLSWRMDFRTLPATFQNITLVIAHYFLQNAAIPQALFQNRVL